jgi:hypothetical protein
LDEFEIDNMVFVDQYQFNPDAEIIMMKQAFSDIDNSDILIAEVSDKAIGVGIEIGYAKARGLIIIYLRNIYTEHSSTVCGTSDYKIFYENELDLYLQLSNVLQKVKPNFIKIE